jgi:hypothetical protein
MLADAQRGVQAEPKPSKPEVKLVTRASRILEEALGVVGQKIQKTVYHQRSIRVRGRTYDRQAFARSTIQLPDRTSYNNWLQFTGKPQPWDA